MMGADVVGYPPRLLITAQTNLDFTSPKIRVEGHEQIMGHVLTCAGVLSNTTYLSSEYTSMQS